MTSLTQLSGLSHILPTLGARQEAVYQCIKAHGSATLFEVCAYMRVFPNEVSGRLTELADLELIRDSGQTRVNPRTHKPATVWVLAKPDDKQLEFGDAA